jgi:DNA primase
MNSVVSDIKSRINIVDFIGQYLKLQKAGANWKANCPFHHEKTPSFMVQEEKQIWHCFGCGKGGDIFGFLMEMEALDFKEALRVLAEKAGVSLTQYKPEAADNKNKILEILELAAKFYETQLWKGEGKVRIMNYLYERGLKEEAIKEFRLGYAPKGWRNLMTFLTGRGYKIEDIEKTGLLVKKEGDRNSNATSYYDRFRDRIIFPISDIMGKVVGYSARVAPGGDESQAKYVNTPETAVYHKSRTLYGIDKAKKEIKDKDQVVLVEGNMDVIASNQAGIKNVAAISGTALTPEQLEILKRYTENLKIFLDMDSAGEAATKKSAETAFQKGLNVYVISSKEGKDAAEIAQKDPSLFLKAVNEALPAVDYFLQKLFSLYDKEKVADKKKIAQEALALVTNIESEIEKNHWVKKLSQELGVEERILLDILIKNEAKNISRTGENKKEVEEIITEERDGILVKKIIGLMLAYPEIWEEISENYGENSCFEDNNLFQIICREGKEAGFKYENLLIFLNDEKLKDFFQKLVFETKYQFSEQSGVEEMDIAQARVMVDQFLGELVREEKKKKLKIIIKDIRKAEKAGDKKELNFLMQEFSRLSQEIKQ